MQHTDLAAIIKETRIRKNLSQEQLAANAGLSLRTVQRVERGETIPRGDTLKRLAAALEISPDEFGPQPGTTDRNLTTLLNLSQLTFLAFPLFGVIAPLTIWLLKKHEVTGIDKLGAAIINFQITWFVSSVLLICTAFMFIGLSIFLIWAMYLLNIVMIILNTIQFNRTGIANYKPAFTLLR